MSIASIFRSKLEELLDCYDRAAGYSPDAYCATPQWHAMAEAQYLEALTIHSESGLLRPSDARILTLKSIERLAAGTVERIAGDYALWGLGFAWKDCPAKEPYLVTTAIVARALCGVRECSEAQALASEAFNGLKVLPHGDIAIEGKSIAAPHFAAGIPQIVDNAIALWLHALQAASDSCISGQCTQSQRTFVTRWLYSRWREDLGWTYSENEDVIDLVHQLYIIDALLAAGTPHEVEEIALRTIAGFRLVDGYVDSMRISTLRSAIDSVTRSQSVVAAFRGGECLIVKRNPARLWSLGALLSCFGAFACKGHYGAFWRSQIRRFPVIHLSTEIGQDFRQEMHVAKGLACALVALRSG